MRLDPHECLRRLATAPSGVLATVGDRGPDLVPVVFAPVGADPAGLRLVTAVDHKPKRTTELARLANVGRDPRVTLLVDRYEDDWGQLWWVRARGLGTVVREEPRRSALLAPLVARYHQYRDRPPAGPVLAVEVVELTGWSAR